MSDHPRMAGGAWGNASPQSGLEEGDREAGASDHGGAPAGTRFFVHGSHTAALSAEPPEHPTSPHEQHGADLPALPHFDGASAWVAKDPGPVGSCNHPSPPLEVQHTASGAMDGISWSYSVAGGLHLDVAPGHLVTAEGNGGFSLDVRTDGAWELRFDGSGDKIGYGFDAGWMDHGPSAPLNQLPGAPPAGNVDVSFNTPQTFNASAGDENVFGSPGRDIIVGGPNDYMDGGGGLNCALYNGPEPVLVDLQHGHGYGGNAEGNSYVNMEQARLAGNGSVVIGNSEGSDLKSGGDNSVLISTGGTGPNAVGVTDELRPDGNNCLLVSTVGADRVVFDPSHGWQLGDTETMLGFNTAHGDWLDLTAAQHNWVAGQSDIANYVKLVDETDGTHVLFNPDGQVATAGVELVDLKLEHGLDLHQLYASHNIVV